MKEPKLVALQPACEAEKEGKTGDFVSSLSLYFLKFLFTFSTRIFNTGN